MIVMTKGMHVIMELYGCPSERLKYVESVKEILEEIVKESEVNAINSSYYQFSPYGVSGVVFLKESHIALHTWPEREYVQFDVSTCGDEEKAWYAAILAVEKFGAKRAAVIAHRRGLENETTVGEAEDVETVYRKLRNREYLLK